MSKVRVKMIGYVASLLFLMLFPIGGIVGVEPVMWIGVALSVILCLLAIIGTITGWHTLPAPTDDEMWK